MISQAIEEFGNQHDLAHLAMDENGFLKLSIDGIGDFQMVYSSPKFLVGLNRRIENSYLLNGQKILSQCHFRTPHFKALHAQLNENTLGLFYLFPEEEVTSSVLSLALDSLTNVMDQIFQG